ncbi:MFS transporter [Paenibacillus sp. OV219]|uniref:MFS transporter n=1 Tax=Paenibacillus sp. OV219 TaxID=1884377 RepID=UPI0008AAE3DE|nr:MFS transporter [Paenibacillus sp. OV219]SEN49463.1 Predicted arabinose efflux permease, MFS family [Paenibacillus sp. OV219]
MTWFREPKYAWIGLGYLWIIGFIGALMRFIMAFFQVQISEDLGISRGFISMAWSTNLLIGALCAPLGGWLADRYGPKRVMLISSIMGIAGTGTVIFGHHDIIFFIGYGVISGFAGIGTTTTYLLIFDWFQHHRAKATGLLASASSLGLAISTPIFVSSSSLTWKDAFIASFVLSIVITLPIILFGIKGTKPRGNKAAGVSINEPYVADGQEERQTVHSPLRGIAVHLPMFIVVAGALFTCGFNMGTVEMNLVAIHQLANTSPDMIALSMSVLGIMEITGSIIVGYWLDRVNKLIMLTLLYGIRIIGFCLLFMHLGLSPIFFAIAFGITYLSAVPGGLLVVNEYWKGKGKQTGWLLFFHQGGGIIGSLTGGISFDYFHNYQVLIGVDVLMCILVTLGYFLLYATRKRSLRLAVA